MATETRTATIEASARVPEATDAVVVGSGPNGLAAAITLAEAGRSVTLLEAVATVGGGVGSEELTLPGFIHDTCSAIHPLVLASPFMQKLPLQHLGLEMAHPEIPFAHPLDDGTAVAVHRSVEETAAGLGADGKAYRTLMQPLVDDVWELIPELLGPLRAPRHPIMLARFGLNGIRSASGMSNARFTGDRARAVFGGLAAHSMLELDSSITAGVALVLGTLAHAVGWPAATGGSQKIADALARHLSSLGGTIRTGERVASMKDVPRCKVVIFDVTPKQLIRIAGDELSSSYKRRLSSYRYGPGVFKLDWALDGPIPWTAPECSRAGTVHVGGTLPELIASEEDVNKGRHPESPYVLLAQQSIFDRTRAPEGKHTVWAYCHVPNGSTRDMTEIIERQIERFAPGFKDRVLARSSINSKQYEARNENYVGGNINGGIQDLRQHFGRPMFKAVPYATSNKKIYICSSSTPPGGGVHGMCGYFAARAALKRAF